MFSRSIPEKKSIQIMAYFLSAQCMPGTVPCLIIGLIFKTDKTGKDKAEAQAGGMA
jgi:hypothetical protein